jgi:hypothetical protein
MREPTEQEKQKYQRLREIFAIGRQLPKPSALFGACADRALSFPPALKYVVWRSPLNLQ